MHTYSEMPLSSIRLTAKSIYVKKCVLHLSWKIQGRAALYKTNKLKEQCSNQQNRINLRSQGKEYPPVGTNMSLALSGTLGEKGQHKLPAGWSSKGRGLPQEGSYFVSQWAATHKAAKHTENPLRRFQSRSCIEIGGNLGPKLFRAFKVLTSTLKRETVRTTEMWHDHIISHLLMPSWR